MTRRLENHNNTLYHQQTHQYQHAPPPGSVMTLTKSITNNEGSGEQLSMSTIVPVEGSPAKLSAVGNRANFYSRLPSVEEQQASRKPFKWSIFDSGPDQEDPDDEGNIDDAAVNYVLPAKQTTATFPKAIRPFREDEAFDLEDRYPNLTDGMVVNHHRPLFAYEEFPEESELEKVRNLTLIAREEMEAAAAAARVQSETPPISNYMTKLLPNSHHNHRPISSSMSQQADVTPSLSHQDRKNSTPISAFQSTAKTSPNGQQQPKKSVSSNIQPVSSFYHANLPSVSTTVPLATADLPTEFIDSAEHDQNFDKNPENSSPNGENQYITAADVDDADNLGLTAHDNDDDHFLPDQPHFFQPLFRRANSEEIIIEEKPLRAKFIGPYLLGDVLGEGSYAKVKEAIDSRSLQRYAVKIFCQSKLKRIPNSREQVLTEIQILRSLPTHANICSMVDLREKREKHKLYLIMQLAVCGMQQLLEQMPQRRLPVWKAHAYFEQLMHAVDFIHSKSIIHKDIKPGNLVLDGHGVLKLIDFGVAQKVDPFAGDDLITTSQGSPAVQSPQVADGTDKFHGFKLDVWSCGVTLYNLVTGELPFNGDTVFELFDNIVNLEHTYPTTLRQDEPSLCDLIDRMLTKDELVRFSVYQIRQHAWVRRNCPFPAHSPIDHQIEERIDAQLSRPITTILPYIECYFRQRQQSMALDSSQSPDHTYNSEVDDDMLMNAFGGDSTGVDIDRCEGVKFQREPRRHVSGAEAAVFAQMQGNYYAGESRMLREALPSPEVLRAVKSRCPEVSAFNFFQNLPSSTKNRYGFAYNLDDAAEEEEDGAAEEENRAMQAEIEAGEFFDENDRKKAQNLLSTTTEKTTAAAGVASSRPSDLNYAETTTMKADESKTLSTHACTDDEKESKKVLSSFGAGGSAKLHHDSIVHITTPPDAGGPPSTTHTCSRRGSTASNKSSRVSAAAARHSQRQAPDQQMTWRCSPASSVRGGGPTTTGSVGKIHHQVQYQRSTSTGVGLHRHPTVMSSSIQQSTSLVKLKPSGGGGGAGILRSTSSQHHHHAHRAGGGGGGETTTDDEEFAVAAGRGSRRAASIAGGATTTSASSAIQEPLLSPTPSSVLRFKKGKKVSGAPSAASGGESGRSSTAAARRMKKMGCNICAIT